MIFEIVEMISGYAGLEVGLAKTDNITEFIESLADFAKIGSMRDEISPGLRAIPASGKTVVCFSVDDTTHTILILCISYAGADRMSRIRDRN